MKTRFLGGKSAVVVFMIKILSYHQAYSNSIKSALAGALMMEVTHDNESCISKRSLPGKYHIY